MTLQRYVYLVSWGWVGWGGVVLFTACVNLMYLGRPAVRFRLIWQPGIGLMYWLLHHYLYCLFSYAQ